MIGRAAYDNPFMLSEIDRDIYGDHKKTVTKIDIFNKYMDYVEKNKAKDMNYQGC